MKLLILSVLAKKSSGFFLFCNTPGQVRHLGMGVSDRLHFIRAVANMIKSNGK